MGTSRVKKIVVIIGGVLSILVIASLIICCKIRVIKYNDNIYVQWSDSEVTSKVESFFSDTKVKLIYGKDRNTIEVPYKDFGIAYKLDVPEGLFNRKFPIYFNLNEVLSFYLYDKEIFKYGLSNLEDKLSRLHNAYLEKTNSDIILHKEKYGENIDVYAVCKEYESKTNEDILTIDLSKYVVEPKVTTEDFKKAQRYLKKIKKWGITYKNGFSLSFSDLLKYISIDGTRVILNKSKLSEYLTSYLSENLKDYNTVGNVRKFKTHNGNSIKLSGGTYGDVVNIDEEVKYVISLINSGKKEKKRVPIYLIDLPDKLPNTYIEVDIGQQYLWYYVNGKVKKSSPVVTGTKRIHDTPKGIYYISEKIPGKYLTGDTYRTWVNRWMRLTNMGVGLHDATWRDSFGGSIYTYSGSHGCINLPYSFAVSLYNAVDWKTAVIIH